MLHAFLQVVMFVFLAYLTVDLARKPRRLPWRPWVIGWWAFNTVLSAPYWLWGHSPLWSLCLPPVYLALAHFAPLIDLALARWADRMWEDLHDR